ncbi:hypothetical protein BRI6_0473 [plant metagenome]|uniref:Uncharacterized protein n=1 Tax=plant metagenome TaxID=1297885 RepID=A0A484TL99_9ZZZZ
MQGNDDQTTKRDGATVYGRGAVARGKGFRVGAAAPRPDSPRLRP